MFLLAYQKHCNLNSNVVCLTTSQFIFQTLLWPFGPFILTLFHMLEDPQHNNRPRSWMFDTKQLQKLCAFFTVDFKLLFETFPSHYYCCFCLFKCQKYPLYKAQLKSGTSWYKHVDVLQLGIVLCLVSSLHNGIPCAVCLKHQCKFALANSSTCFLLYLYNIWRWRIWNRF